jgi:hypothetical protein
MEQTECSEILTFKLQMSGNNPEESIQHSKHGENLKSRIILHYLSVYYLFTFCLQYSDNVVQVWERKKEIKKTLSSNSGFRIWYISLQLGQVI